MRFVISHIPTHCRLAALTRNVETGRGKGEPFELKARRNGATDQRIIPGTARGLPVMFRHDDLRRASL